MDVPPLKPEHAWLQDFLLGRLDDERQKRAEEQLRGSPWLLDILQQLGGQGLLIEGVPGALIAEVPVDPAELPPLVRRLTGLRPAGDTDPPVFGETVSPEP